MPDGIDIKITAAGAQKAEADLKKVARAEEGVRKAAKKRRRPRSPIPWFGGKGRMVANLLPLLPPCLRYVEPFGGGASILFAREPAELEVYNDLDEGLVNFFRVIADRETFGRFYRRVALLPYSRAIYDQCRREWASQTDPIPRAAMWYVVARQSFSGRFAASWGTTVTASSRGRAESVANWQSALDALPLVHARLSRVQIEQADWRRVLDRYDTPETLFYCDPPYPHASRDKSTRYAHELTDADHEDLVEKLLAVVGMVCLSSYPGGAYRRLGEAGWHRTQWRTACYAAGRTRATGIQGAGSALRMQPRTEVLWRNPAAMKAMPPIHRVTKSPSNRVTDA